MPDPDPEFTPDTPVSKKTSKRLLKLVAILIVLAMLYYSLFVLLPSELDWNTVWADLQALSAAEIAALVAAGLVSILALGWTSKASLPDLTLYQGTESSATSQLSAFVFPPPPTWRSGSRCTGRTASPTSSPQSRSSSPWLRGTRWSC